MESSCGKLEQVELADAAACCLPARLRRWRRGAASAMETYCAALLSQEKSLDELQKHLRSTEVRRFTHSHAHSTPPHLPSAL